jgi:hypothetical protein
MFERDLRLCHIPTVRRHVVLGRFAAAVACLAAIAGCHAVRPAVRPDPSTRAASWNYVRAFDLVAHHVFDKGLLGGVSGLVYDPRANDWIAVSDSRRAPQWFHLRFRLAPGRVWVDISDPVRAVAPAHAAAWWSDFEAVAVLPNGNLLIASEGDVEDGQRVPAALWQYDRQGQYVSSIKLPEKFTPDAAGRPPRGLRDNNGFEGMALDLESSRLWAVSEAPLQQDDDLAGFDRGARARMLEVSIADGDIRVTRELVYPIEAVGRMPNQPPDAVVIDQGVSELTLLPGGVLLSLERAFVRDKATDWSMNVIRLFRVDLDQADDVSAAASLREVPTARPVRKQLLADLSTFAPNLDPRLWSLDNFEAAAEGPMTADGRPTLLLMTDDNFNDQQVTALLVLAARND